MVWARPQQKQGAWGVRRRACRRAYEARLIVSSGAFGGISVASPGQQLQHAVEAVAHGPGLVAWFDELGSAAFKPSESASLGPRQAAGRRCVMSAAAPS